jgi:hypothetical protein
MYRKLIGVPYKWGSNSETDGMDCFHYAVYARKQFPDQRQIDPTIIEWIFDEYPDEDSSPPELPRLLCERFGVAPRLNPKAVQPEKHLDLVLLHTQSETIPYALGTLLMLPEGEFIAYMGNNGSNVVSKTVVKRSGVRIHSYWNPTKLLIKDEPSQ